jgi:tRNA G18 (ribose-2'-O)-methylase SpoU
VEVKIQILELKKCLTRIKSLQNQKVNDMIEYRLTMANGGHPCQEAQKNKWTIGEVRRYWLKRREKDKVKKIKSKILTT